MKGNHNLTNVVRNRLYKYGSQPTLKSSIYKRASHPKLRTILATNLMKQHRNLTNVVRICLKTRLAPSVIKSRLPPCEVVNKLPCATIITSLATNLMHDSHMLIYVGELLSTKITDSFKFKMDHSSVLIQVTSTGCLVRTKITTKNIYLFKSLLSI